jgi:orotate phosphoribosyltransferase
MNPTHESIQEEAANILLNIKAVSFRFDPPFTYTSGLKSPIYLDNRLVMSHPDERSQIIKLYVETIKQHIGIENVQCVSGTATAAIPQASWIADHLSVPMVFVRSSAKAHGKQRKLEGFVQKGDRVLIIEDHISTGGHRLHIPLV